MARPFFLCLLMLFLVFSSASARAEGRCPDGYFPIGGGNAGWEGCAPMGPDAGANDAEAVESQWEMRWGAVATSDGGAMGVSVLQKNKENAEREALVQCQAHSRDKPCEIRIAYFNQCVAVAWGDGGSRMTSSPDIKDAEDTALNNCKNTAANCDLYYSACSYAERVQ